MYSIFGFSPSAAYIALIRSLKLRALPVPTLKMPLTDGVSSMKRTTATASST
jgi:hypothetical protein